MFVVDVSDEDDVIVSDDDEDDDDEEEEEDTAEREPDIVDGSTGEADGCLGNGMHGILATTENVGLPTGNVSALKTDRSGIFGGNSIAGGPDDVGICWRYDDGIDWWHAWEIG